MKDKEVKVFTKGLSVRGNLGSSYVFVDEAEREQWLATELPKLVKQYGALQVTKTDLDGLKIGDHCHVAGEGLDVFEIKALVNNSPFRYSFLVSPVGDGKGAWTEEVYKCWRA